MKEVTSSPPSSTGARVIYERDGWSEWYENTAKGLEQGFTIERRPDGEGELRIAGKVPGGLKLQARADGAIDFIDDHGACAIRYGELHVWDVHGDEVPSRLSLAGSELAILVEDAGATYPITIDPLMTSPAWTAEPDQVGALFGYSVATAGDVNGDGFSDVIVGALAYDNGQNEEGRAFVYLGSAAGLSTTAAWTAEGDQASAQFGHSVATAGDVNGDGFSDVVVGSYVYDNGEQNEGRAFVYHGSAAGLSTAAAWTVEGEQAEANFGFSVASAGDVNGDGFSDLIVGAWSYDNGQGDEGRAYVYHGSAAGLLTAAAWTAESDQVGGFFATSVATAGDVNGDGFADVIVGAWGYNNGQNDEGRAFVYHGSGAGLSTTAAWSAESNQISAFFGWRVATAGDVNGDGFSDIAVAANLYDNGQLDEGRVFVYHGSVAGLSTTAARTVEGNQMNAQFGVSVSTAGDVNGDGYADLIVGAHTYDIGQPDEGLAFVYQGSASGLLAFPSWTTESNQAGAQYGFSVATAGDVNGDGYSDVIVGSYVYDNGQTDEGRTFVYHGSAAGLAANPAWTTEANQDNARYGSSVATAGDVNGDGYDDVIVGAETYNNGVGTEGRAFVYLGSAAGLSTTAAWTAGSGQANAGFGASAGTAGDVNGDGYSDVIVGAPSHDNGQTNEGRALVYLGSATGLATTPAWTAESEQANARFGFSVATAGDVNGDGFSDVVVGAYLYNNGQTSEGRAFAYLGSAAGLSATAAWTAESDQNGGQLGTSVATAGDVNGDGFSDVVVGAPWYDNPQIEEGRAYVYLGSAAGLSTAADWTAEGNQVSAGFGWSVASAGDVNGDGFCDVLVGAVRYDNGQDGEGRAFVYHGSAAGLSTTAAWTAESNNSGSQFGVSVATAGDVNGDGHSDVIVGANAYTNDQEQANEGRAYFYRGSAAGLSTTANWTAEGNQELALFGYSVAAAGDVNGDGFSDAIVGALLYDNGHSDEGRVFVYYGNAGPCRTSFAHQQRTDGTTPIAHLGQSDSDTQFRIRAILPSAYGRTRMQMEHEVKPLGVLFDGLDTVTGNYVDVGDDGEVEVSQLASTLAPDTPYHWRARARYDPAKTPFQRYGPWLHMPLNGWNETDLRTREAQTGIETAAAPPAFLRFEAPRPNPFGSSADLGYTLARSGRVHLAVYDAAGRARRVLVDAVQRAGRQVATWDGRDARGTALPRGSTSRALPSTDTSRRRSSSSRDERWDDCPHQREA